MTDKPLDRPVGIADLLACQRDLGRISTDWYGDCWYWCRRHEQAHKVGEPHTCFCNVGIQEPYGTHDTECPQGSDKDCIDIGPFMSEREANRLNRGPSCSTMQWEPLGMKVEV